MQSPLISVLVPVYNHEKYIAKAIESIINQTYNNIEIIISDDSSLDSSLSIIMDYAEKDNRIQVLDNKINKGICGNFNQLFDNAKGSFIVFFSGDDVMLPTKIERELSLLLDDSDAVVIHHNAWVIDENDNILYKHLQKNLPLLNPLDWGLKVDWFHAKKISPLLPTTCLARREYYLGARYNSHLKGKHELLFTIEDYYHFPMGKWLYIKEPLSMYRMHPENFSNSKEYQGHINSDSLKLFEIANENCPGLRRRIKKARAFFLYERIAFNMFENENEKSKFLKYFERDSNLWSKIIVQIAKIAIKTKLYWPFSNVLHSMYVPIYKLLYSKHVK